MTRWTDDDWWDLHDPHMRWDPRDEAMHLVEQVDLEDHFDPTLARVNECSLCGRSLASCGCRDRDSEIGGRW